MKHSLDFLLFRKQFPPFANETAFSDEQLLINWDMAVEHISAEDGPLLNGSSLQLALSYMTAHLLSLSSMVGLNPMASTGIVSGTVIDKVQVQLTAPPFKDGWDFWLSQTAYGQQLLALLKAKSAGGFYLGGRPEKKPFRKVGGRF